MAGSLSLLSAALSSLRAARLIMDTANHNVANANTPGYSRQEVYLSAALPYTAPASNMPDSVGQIGTGVSVLSIKSAKVESYITSYRKQSNKYASISTALDYAKRIQNIVSDENSGISSAFSKFISDLKSLSIEPTSISIRQTVLSSANVLVEKLKNTYKNLTDLSYEIDDRVQESVDKFNSIIKDIAELNKQIVGVRANGNNANDLEDKRDLLYKQLSELINIKVVKKKNGSSYAFIKGKYIIMDDTYKELKTQLDVNNHKQVVWSDLSPLDITSGKIYSLIEYRDRKIGTIATPNSYLNKLNNYVMSFLNEFNARHRLGYDLNNITGIDFFSGTDISNINVAISNPESISASVAHLMSVQNINKLEKKVDISLPLNQLIANDTFLVNPSANGSFSINGVVINWNQNQSLGEIIDNINNSNAGVIAEFDSESQTIILKRNTKENQLSPSNINIADITGNFTQFTFLNTAINEVPDSDNSNLIYLSDLDKDKLASLSNLSVKDYFSTIISDIGEDTNTQDIRKQAQDQILKNLEKDIQEISGVNLNEEAVKISKAQYAYQAALRITSIYDDIMNRTINQLGVS